MPKYEVQVILERTYGVAVIEADDREQAREKAGTMDKSEFNTAVDRERDVLLVDQA